MFHPSNFRSKLFLSIAVHLNASPVEIVEIVLFYGMLEFAHVELPWCILLSEEQILEYKQRGTIQTFLIIKREK